MNIGPFRDFIKARLGLHFGEDADARLGAILDGRVSATETTDIAGYLALTAANPVEFRTLTALLTVNETYFYREPQHLALLTEHLLPTLLANRHLDGRTGSPVRILSVGCSTGEEPYSIAIALRERYGDNARQLFELLGGDVDHEAIDRARAGVYTAFSFRALPEELRDRYFSSINATHRQINAAIHAQVRFVHLNLLDAAYPDTIQPQDVIFFRNVSIYFDEPTRRRVLARLKGLLNPCGYLIVGASETLANDFGLMRLHALDGVFLFDDGTPGPEPMLGPAATRSPSRQRARGATPATTLVSAAAGLSGNQPGSRPANQSDPQAGRAPDPGSIQAPRQVSVGHSTPPVSSISSRNAAVYETALALAHAERFDAALNSLEPECAHADAPARLHALQAHLFLERGDAQRAVAAAERALIQDNWSSDALLLLARCARLRGDTQASIGLLKRTLYGSPTCWRAHYQLAEIYRASGESGPAAREYRILLRRLEEDPSLSQNPSELPCRLTAKDLRFLCETRLARLLGTTT